MDFNYYFLLFLIYGTLSNVDLETLPIYSISHQNYAKGLTSHAHF